MNIPIMGHNNRTMGPNTELQNKKINRGRIESLEYCDCLLFTA